MKHVALTLTIVLTMAFCGVAQAGDALPKDAETGLVTEVVGLDGAARDALAGRTRPLQLAFKRQEGAGPSEQAYAGIVAAITRLAQAKGITVLAGAQEVPAAAVKAEFDTWFYVEGQKLNPDLVHMGDYAEFELSGRPLPEAVASSGSGGVNVVRVAAGLFGFARGWLPASFSGSMVAHGVREGAGSGSAADSKPLGDPERLALGLQRAVTEVRIEVDGQTTTFQVHVSRKPLAHTTVDALTETTWQLALQVLAGRAEQLAVVGR